MVEDCELRRKKLLFASLSTSRVARCANESFLVVCLFLISWNQLLNELYVLQCCRLILVSTGATERLFDAALKSCLASVSSPMLLSRFCLGKRGNKN